MATAHHCCGMLRRPMTIRPARPDDADALRAIDEATWAPDISPGSGAAGVPPDRLGDTLVAEVGGAVAGYVLLGPPTPLASNAHVLQIQGLAVDPARRRGGVGRALVEAAATEAAARGARRLTLRVLAPNAGARRLYAACGFVEEGVLREEFLLAGRYVDDVLMARRLS